MRALSVVVGLVLGLHLSIAHGKELWERPWIEVESPSFRVMSMLDEKRTRDLVIDLENFRRAVEMLTNLERFDAPIPTRIFVLSKPQKDFGFDRGMAGYFSPQMRANYAVVASSGKLQDEALKHEYVHFLMHNGSSKLYPAWFNEGFAEFLSTLTVKNGLIEFGKPLGLRVDWLALTHWMPYRKLLEVRDVWSLGQQQISMFYAQSWLLVHYLNFSGAVTNLATCQREYFALSESGTAPVEAFERAFGLDVDRMRMELYDYARNMRYYQLKPKSPFPEPAITVRAMAAADVAAQLGLLALVNGKEHTKAQPYFDAALALNPSHCDALIGRADLLKFSGRFDEAKPHYERAIALDPNDPEHELDFGEFYLDHADVETDAAKREQLLIEARRRFARSYKIDSGNPETLAMNGRSYLGAGGDPRKAIASLEAAHALLPAQFDIRYLLAKAYLAASEKALAREQLETLIAWSDGERAEEIRSLLASLDVE